MNLVSLASQRVERVAVAGRDDEPLGEPRKHAELRARALEVLREQPRR